MIRKASPNRFTFVPHWALAALLLWPASAAWAVAPLPFTEDFDADVNGWVDNARDSATFVSSGGPDGATDSFARTTFNFSTFTANPTFGASLVTTRGEANDDASGDAFVGDWITEDVDRFTGYVRHDHTESLDFFVRFASSFNFPGALAGGTPAFTVAPDTWTKLEVDISADGGPWTSFEGSDFNSVFSSVGNVQFGIDVPTNLFEQDITVNFDTDKPTIASVPEPSTLVLAGLGAVGAAAIAFARRRRRAK